jgi:ABC-type nitrate/sulfonate/bicarbonate transport system substrate-binding protein
MAGMTRRVLLARIGGAAATLGLAACSGSPGGSGSAASQPSTSSASPASIAAPASPHGQIQVGYVSVSVSNVPTFSAVQGGFFKEQGLDVSIVNIGTSPQAVAAMLSGELPLNTGISGTQMVAANRKGGGTRLLASSVNTFPFSVITQPSIKTVADLSGTKFGVSQFGSASDTAARLFLSRNNLDFTKDLTLVQTGGVSQTLAALQASGIDAGLLTPPVDRVAIQAGFSELADIGALGIEYCTNGVGTTKAYLDKNHDVLVAILKAIVQGVHRFKTDQSFGEGVIETWTNTSDPKIVTASWKPFAAAYLQDKLYVTDAGIQTVLDELAATDPAARTADPKAFYDNSILQSLETSGFFSSLGIPADAG